ncbi:MAG: tRNA pseudouridine(55) synthase TruB [Armatimonadetes bacterium]|nr:tRNA pseudouridine(55) synthase TruB [Armatimonadota bacterium]
MRDGVLNLDKPKGITSHDAVVRVRRTLGVKKAGHAGTLDPMATGVLPVCIGAATRIVEYLSGSDKSYRAQALFGLTTDTQDAEGRPLLRRDASPLTAEAVLSVLPEFRGDLLQIPPMASALKHEGRRLYELARAGVEVDRPPRPVRIACLEMIAFSPGEEPSAVFEITCSKGTYIRTLVADIGERLEVGAHLTALTRERVGIFRLEDSFPADSLPGAGEWGASFLSIETALSDLPRFGLAAAEAARVRCGSVVSVDYPGPCPAALALDKQGRALAIGAIAATEEGRIFRPRKVLAGEAAS